MNFKATSFATLLLGGWISVAVASIEIPATAQTRPIALKGATIHPVSGPDISSGTIVFDHGKITALGSMPSFPQVRK